MYKKAYGIVETLAPLHVGATAGEESGNLNLIFRDQFTQTGILPGSSLRGRLRAEMRLSYGEDAANYWYGHEAESGKPESTSESVVKLEHASIVWLPVFCPGQPIVWVSCPRLLMRYQRMVGNSLKGRKIPEAYTGSQGLQARESKDKTGKVKKVLFFNLGFLTVDKTDDLSCWFPLEKQLPAVVVADNDMGMIHDMALYRQSRVALKKDQKVVDGKAFFNTEALPEGTLLAFPIAIRDDKKDKQWEPFDKDKSADIYLGGLESIGFGHCYLTLKGV